MCMIIVYTKTRDTNIVPPKFTEQTKARFKAIEYLTFWEGGVNASRLSRIFGIQPNVISKSISQYRELHPGMLFYDAKDPEKLYTATSSFTPTYISPYWSSYVNFIVANGGDHISHLYGYGAVTEFITPICNPKPEITRVLLKAIRLGKAVQMDYRSRKNPEGLNRKIIPKALSHDGIRWHCRAFCCLRERYSDFNLGRIDNLVIDAKPITHRHEDIDWSTFVDIKVNAHPNLRDEEKALVLGDFGKKEGFSLRTRGALVDYTIQFYRLSRDVETSSPDQHPLIVENIKELKPYLFGGAEK